MRSIKMYCDNFAAVTISNNIKSISSDKYIDVKLYIKSERESGKEHQIYCVHAYL